MKLIIDIPEEVVTAIQNGEDYRYDIHTTIAQGIPYESSGDLISREALKQMMPAPIEEEYKRVHQIIDNAPAVDLWQMRQEATENALKKAEVLYGRPQGKWIRKVDEVGFVSHICSKCGAEIEVEDCSDDKFCFNCGAPMKGGKE